MHLRPGFEDLFYGAPQGGRITLYIRLKIEPLSCNHNGYTVEADSTVQNYIVSRPDRLRRYAFIFDRADTRSINEYPVRTAFLHHLGIARYNHYIGVLAGVRNLLNYPGQIGHQEPFLY